MGIFCVAPLRAQRFILECWLRERYPGCYVTVHVKSTILYCLIVQCLPYIIIIEDSIFISCVSIDSHYVHLLRSTDQQFGQVPGAACLCPMQFSRGAAKAGSGDVGRWKPVKGGGSLRCQQSVAAGDWNPIWGCRPEHLHGASPRGFLTAC